MQDITELERRITAALNRIGQGIEAVAASPPPGEGVPDADTAAEVARLTEALDEERMANAQLSERIRMLRDRDRDRDGQAQKAQGAMVDKLTRQLDVQGLELQRMRKTVIQLRESIRMLTDAQITALPDVHLINKGMLAELDALRATRATDLAELDEILAELDPLVGSVQPEEQPHA